VEMMTEATRIITMEVTRTTTMEVTRIITMVAKMMVMETKMVMVTKITTMEGTRTTTMEATRTTTMELLISTMKSAKLLNKSGLTCITTREKGTFLELCTKSTCHSTTSRTSSSKWMLL